LENACPKKQVLQTNLKLGEHMNTTFCAIHLYNALIFMLIIISPKLMSIVSDPFHASYICTPEGN